MINMNLGAQKNIEAVKEEFEKVNKVIEGIIEEMDNKTILWVTGNKAFDLKSKSDLRDHHGMIDEEIVDRKHEPPTPSSAVKTGLLLITKRIPEHEDKFKKFSNFRGICPNNLSNNKISSSKNSTSYLKFFPILPKHDSTHVLNLTSTLSSLLGLSIPFSNIGSIIPQTYMFTSAKHWSTFYRNLVIKYSNNLEQLLRYREKYFHEHDYKSKLHKVTHRAYWGNTGRDGREGPARDQCIRADYEGCRHSA
jgi:hypothetical protein